MNWGGITYEIAIALTFWAVCIVCGLCWIVGGVRRLYARVNGDPAEKSFDDLADGRSPASQGRAGALRAEPRAGSQAKPLIPNARGE